MTDPVVHLTEAEAQGLAAGAGDARAAAHAAACPACRGAVEEYRALSEALAGLDRPALPPGFTAGVLARIEERDRRAARERRHAVAVLGVLAAATAAAFALAGPAAWAPVLSGAADALAASVHAARVGAALLPRAGVVRLVVVGGAAALAVPFLLGLARLTAPGRGA